MAPRHNLPISLTSFVGRDHEIERLLTTLETSRLVSLTGVGGCGKTRLALRVAEELHEVGADGPWMVDLSTVTDSEQIPRLVASTVDILLDPGSDPVLGLTRQLADRETVLILDTCEHVVGRVAELTHRLLRSCARLRVIATTREPLGVEGEMIRPVSGLDPTAARQLFAERAQLVAPMFKLADSEADVDAVCARVDHLPLGIELAAAWTRALSPAQIAAGLEDSNRLLSGGPRGTTPRHLTLGASMRWSHDLLDANEQALFRRLAVFAGSFTLDAVAAVCADLDDEKTPLDWLEPLGRLLDKSLITVSEVDGELRYRLLDTIRQYAEQNLRASGEEGASLERHLVHFTEIAQEAEPGLDQKQDRWRPILEGHHDNLVKALRWGLAEGGERRATACRLAAALGRYWLLRGLSAEGLDFLERALHGVQDPHLRERLLAAQAALAMVSGRMGLLETSTALVLEDADADAVSRARCLTLRSFPAFFLDFDSAQRLAREGHAAAVAAGDPFARDWALVMEAYSLQTRNLHNEALETGSRAYEGSIVRGDRFCAAFALGVRLFTLMVTGDVRSAVATVDDVLDLARPLRDYFAVGTNTVNASQVLGASGDLERARVLIDSVVTPLDDTDDAEVVGFMVADGLVHLWAGELDAAVSSFERGVRPSPDGTLGWTAVRCLPGLVGALRRLGRFETATRTARKGAELARRFQAPYEETLLLDELARLTADHDQTQARSLLHRSLAIRQEHGLLTNITDSLEALAALDCRDAANLPRAARLLGASEAARERMGFPVPPVDREVYDDRVANLVNAMAQDTETSLDAEWGAGRALSLGDAVILAQRGRGSRGRPGSGWDSLSPAEREVVDLVRAGLTNPEVAARLFMSRSTVKTHLSSVYQKLGVANRTELASLAGNTPSPSHAMR
jgi:predicted ATPase/DNA-binding CsgD family transcriptional regulator